jgi:hypothetical protein
MQLKSVKTISPSWLWLGLWICTLVACKPQSSIDGPDKATAQNASQSVAPAKAKQAPLSFEASADQLLSQRLPLEETSQGWVRLFDGYTLFGWEIASEANWRVEDKSIVVDSGDVGLLCTSVGWADFELKLEFKADANTNSGIFLRTPLEPEDPALDCYEVNIAPTDNPFPTGSIVKRQKVTDGQPGSIAAPLDPAKWHLYEMTMQGGELTLRINGKETCRYKDPNPLPARRIGLQHNSGKVAFRDIKIRPLHLKPLLDNDLSQWKKFPDKPGEFVITPDSELRVTGGRGQIESKTKFGNFVALVEAKTQSEKLNSGLFYRCIEGSAMDGYECQINHGIIDGNPLKPVDCGTGGIFRRQDARIVAANDTEWFSMLLVADGLQSAAWVNGLQVTDWTDEREPHENPRNGSRREPGTMMIQAHDPTTDILFRKLDVTELIR